MSESIAKSDATDPGRHWSLDRRIPIAMICAFLMSAAGVMWQGGRMQFVLEDHDRRIKQFEDDNRSRVAREAERDNRLRDLIATREREATQRDREVRDVLADLRAAVASLREAVSELRTERRRSSVEDLSPMANAR